MLIHLHGVKFMLIAIPSVKRIARSVARCSLQYME